MTSPPTDKLDELLADARQAVTGGTGVYASTILSPHAAADLHAVEKALRALRAHLTDRYDITRGATVQLRVDIDPTPWVGLMLTMGAPAPWIRLTRSPPR